MVKIFRRYKSTIYGNYRKAYLIDGALTGAVMSVIVLMVNLFSGSQMQSPDSFVPEIVMMVGIAWSAVQYRKGLEDQKVTFKELMLLGLGIGVISAAVYGLFIYAYGSIDINLVQQFQEQRISVMEPAETSVETRLSIEAVRHYGAGDWGFIAGFRSAVLSILVAFLVAVALRSEKAPVVEKKK